jgi:hypothetical protein
MPTDTMASTRRFGLGSLLILLACGTVACLILGVFRDRSSRVERGPGGSLNPAPNDSFVDQKTLQGALALEAERNRLDQTVWSLELTAQKHEDVFVQLWDQMRSSRDPIAVLQGFEFGVMNLGTLGQAEVLDHSATLARFGAQTRKLRPADWQNILKELYTQGWRIENSEWRHVQFRPAANAAASSVIAVTLHGTNPQQSERFVLRGSVQVSWRGNASAGEAPFPERIDASEIELLRRRGEPAFEWALARDIKPDRNPIFIDPLILRDLNGDGLAEIILACRNQIFWNLGNGRFQAATLCAGLTNAINTAILADFTGDAAPDFLAADASGLLLFPGNTEGRSLDRSERTGIPLSPAGGEGKGEEIRFIGNGRRVQFTNVPLLNPFVMTAGDIDADGDLDLWLAQYKLPYVEGQMPRPYYGANDGFPSFLLLNDGNGGFVDRTDQAGLAAKRFRRTYSASFVDLDDDADLDLFVISDFAGADVYFNDGRGHFTDVTSSALSEPHLFGMAHTFGDYDLDGRLDCFAIGMNSFVAQRLEGLRLNSAGTASRDGMWERMAYGNRLYLQRPPRFELTPLSDQVAQSGWSWGVTSFDFDNDADLDLYIANGHKSRASAKDYESQFWRHDIHLATSNPDPVRDVYFQSTASRLYGAGYSYGGYHKNLLYMNRAGQSFVEIGHLLGVAMELDCRNVVSDDLDGDGKMDLLVTTLEEWPQTRQSLHIFRNRCPAPGNWIGLHLREGGPGFSPVGARVTLHTANRKQARPVVTGDSYRSQHAPTLHFGLGAETNVVGIEVRWVNGKTNWLSQPAINRYHWMETQ